MRLLGNTVLVKVHEEKDDLSVGGLIMSTKEDNHTNYLRATVVERSDGYTENGISLSMKVKVKDEVIIPKHAGQVLTIKGTEYKLLREPDILVILENDEIES